MPAALVKTFAKKSGKSEAEVEKMWTSIKKDLLKDQPESSPTFYRNLVGRLKNALKLEHYEEIEDALYKNFLAEKEEKKKKDSVKKMKDREKDTKKDKTPKDDTDPDGDIDDVYNTVDMLRAVIEVIRETDDPKGEAGPEGDLEYGLEIIHEIAEQIPEETAEIIIDALFQYYDVEEEDVEDIVGDDDDEEETDEELNEMLIEAISPVRAKRLRYLKKKRKKQLGKRASSMTFKRNYKFDTKKGRFVKRAKAVSVVAMRKKARIFKKVVRKGSTKAKAKRTKKKLIHVKDPYSSGKTKK